MSTILRISDLMVSARTSQGSIPIIKGVSLDVKRGRVLAIVGESGSGKSMTAHAIMRLLPDSIEIDSGSIVLDPEGEAVDVVALPRYGQVMRGLRGRRIGMVFQDSMSALNPVHPVGKQVTEMLRQHKKMSRRAAREQVIELFSSLGIPEPERRFSSYPHQFSGGMRQRVMIAIALICRPEVVIADEPTTALDMTVQKQVMSVFTDLASTLGVSVIMITHNMGLVAEYADDVAVMYQGVIVEKGEVDEVLTRPQHPYTQALIASVPALDSDPQKPLATVADYITESTEVRTA